MDLSVFEDFDALDIGASSLAASPVAAEPIKTPEERRIEWMNARRGYFTASKAHRLMGYEDKDELPKGAITYAQELAIERLTVYNPERDTFKSSSMQWGNDTELDAIVVFSERYGIEFAHTGENQMFFTLGGFIGGTPDGINADLKTGIEIKCPNSTTHFQYLQMRDQFDFKAVCKDYYWQVQQLMMVTGFDNWFFVSFDPDFIEPKLRLKVLEISVDDTDAEKLLNRTNAAKTLRDEIVNQILRG